MKKALIVGLAVALVVALAVPALAYDVKIGSRIRQQFGYNFTSEERNQSDSSLVANFTNMSGSSRLRAFFTSDDKMAGAYISLGLGNTITSRSAYAWYKIGNCTFTAGRNYGWLGEIIVNGGWSNDVWGTGHIDISWQSSIGLEWESGNFGFQVQLREPRGSAVTANTQDFNYKFPAIELTAKIQAGNFTVAPGVGFARYDWEAASGDDSYNSWVLLLPVQVSFGGFSVFGEIHYGVNLGVDWGQTSSFAVPIDKGDNTIEDTTSLGGFVGFSYVSGPFELTGAIGANKYDNDEWKNSLGYADDNFTEITGFLGVNYRIHQHLLLRPEVSYHDYGDSPVTGADSGNKWVLGLRFQFDF